MNMTCLQIKPCHSLIDVSKSIIFVFSEVPICVDLLIEMLSFYLG